MNYILRNFFYALGLALLFAAFALNPATAQFKDLLLVMHTTIFWQAIGVAAITLIGADLIFTGTYSKAIDVVFNTADRLRKARANKTAS
jgi:hypothetical protein